MLKLNNKQILRELGGRPGAKKIPKTLSINQDVYKAFERLCKHHGLTVSHVVERLMADFVEDIAEVKSESKAEADEAS